MFTVVTRIPDAKKGETGNLALALPLYVHDGDYDEPARPASEVLGAGILALRWEVFRLGEVLTLDHNDRDIHGRKPSKWDIDVEYFDDIHEALARAREVIAGAEDDE